MCPVVQMQPSRTRSPLEALVIYRLIIFAISRGSGRPIRRWAYEPNVYVFCWPIDAVCRYISRFILPTGFTRHLMRTIVLQWLLMKKNLCYKWRGSHLNPPVSSVQFRTGIKVRSFTYHFHCRLLAAVQRWGIYKYMAADFPGRAMGSYDQTFCFFSPPVL